MDNSFPKKLSGTSGLGMAVPESHHSPRCPARAQVSGSGVSHDKAPDQLDANPFQKTFTEIITRKNHRSLLMMHGRKDDGTDLTPEHTL